MSKKNYLYRVSVKLDFLAWALSRMMAALLSSFPVTLYFYRVKLYN